MTFKNIFNSGGSRAESAEGSARNVSEKIPGARPEREGVDPELYEDLPPETERDPKTMRETSPEALAVLNGFITPLFESTRTVAAEQRSAAEDPASTSDMASAAKDEAFTHVEAEIRDEDRPRIDDEEREELRKANDRAAAKKQ